MFYIVTCDCEHYSEDYDEAFDTPKEAYDRAVSWVQDIWIDSGNSGLNPQDIEFDDDNMDCGFADDEGYCDVFVREVDE